MHRLGEHPGLGMNVLKEGMGVLARTQGMWLLVCLLSRQSVRLSDILGSS